VENNGEQKFHANEKNQKEVKARRPVRGALLHEI